jgi:hypothetical protein
VKKNKFNIERNERRVVKERKVVKEREAGDLRKGALGIQHDGRVVVHCKTLYTRTKSRVGKKREMVICKKVCSGRDCNEAVIDEKSQAVRERM